MKRDPYTFTVLAHPLSLGQHTTIEVSLDQYTRVRATRALLEYLLHVDDYDLLTRLCATTKKEGEEPWGVGPLYQGLRDLFPYEMTDRDYQSWLSLVEKEVQLFMMSRNTSAYSRYSPYFPSSFVKSIYPYPLVIYALSLLTLGHEALGIADTFLYEAKKIDRECPGLAWAYSQQNSLYYQMLSRSPF